MDKNDRPTDAVRQDMHIEVGGADLQGEVDDHLPFALLIINKCHQGEGEGEGEGGEREGLYMLHTSSTKVHNLCASYYSYS